MDKTYAVDSPDLWGKDLLDQVRLILDMAEEGENRIAMEIAQEAEREAAEEEQRRQETLAYRERQALELARAVPAALLPFLKWDTPPEERSDCVFLRLRGFAPLRFSVRMVWVVLRGGVDQAEMQVSSPILPEYTAYWSKEDNTPHLKYVGEHYGDGTVEDLHIALARAAGREQDRIALQAEVDAHNQQEVIRQAEQARANDRAAQERERVGLLLPKAPSLGEELVALIHKIAAMKPEEVWHPGWYEAQE